MVKLISLLLISCSMLVSIPLNAQCPGTWSASPTLNYLCANGPFLQHDLGLNNCPTSAQATYTFSSPVQNIELIFSAFGSGSAPGDSRMAIFLNGNLIDLNLACNIVLGCQSPEGTHIIGNSCLIDSTPGSDGGISGFIYLTAASFGLPSINSIGVAVSEPNSSGTIFDIGLCNDPILNALGNDTTLCQSETLTLDATTPNATYIWQDNSTNPTFNVTQQGTYWVTATVNNCNTSDTVNVNFNSIPNIDLGNDTTLCHGETLTLDATTSNATYIWQDNSTNPTFNAIQQGTYWVEVTVNNCNTTDTILINEEDCAIILELPNVFTPNNDGINDLFVPIISNGIISMKTIIYNRWGNKIFKTNNPLIEWEGQEVSDGTYYWIVYYTDKNGIVNSLNGFVTILK